MKDGWDNQTTSLVGETVNKGERLGHHGKRTIIPLSLENNGFCFDCLTVWQQRGA